jgi:hypothetical protein
MARPNRDPPGSKTSGSARRIRSYSQFLGLDTTRHRTRRGAAMGCRNSPGDEFPVPGAPIPRNVGVVDTRQGAECDRGKHTASGVAGCPGSVRRWPRDV